MSKRFHCTGLMLVWIIFKAMHWCTPLSVSVKPEFSVDVWKMERGRCSWSYEYNRDTGIARLCASSKSMNQQKRMRLDVSTIQFTSKAYRFVKPLQLGGIVAGRFELIPDDFQFGFPNEFLVLALHQHSSSSISYICNNCNNVLYQRNHFWIYKTKFMSGHVRSRTHPRQSWIQLTCPGMPSCALVITLRSLRYFDVKSWQRVLSSYHFNPLAKIKSQDFMQ